MTAFLIGAAVYLAVVVAAVLLCKGITLADRIEQPDDDWLADQPAEILAPAEVDRRISRFEAWL